MITNLPPWMERRLLQQQAPGENTLLIYPESGRYVFYHAATGSCTQLSLEAAANFVGAREFVGPQRNFYALSEVRENRRR
jgi:hypothetical protein